MQTKADLTGLTDQEVQHQRARGLGNDVKIKTGRTYGQIARDNLFTFFNIVLFSLAAVLLLLGSPRDAFFTGAIAFLNVIVATTQEVRAKRKLDQIALLTRPKATVVRAGQEQTVDPTEIVAGDLLVAGPGDQVLADGVVLGEGKADLDESLLTGESDLMPKTAGDTVLSGSFVVNGRLYYTAEKVGAESFANKLTASARRFTRELTPLQREVNLVVRLLLLLVLFFGALIGINYFLSQRADLLESVQAASVVFGLAPSSLFLMIVVAYALGAIRIADKGALVQQANAVESLSHVDMLCLDKTGTLTANAIQLDTVQPLGELDEETLKHLLGDFARSATASNRTNEAILAATPGTKRDSRRRRRPFHRRASGAPWPSATASAQGSMCSARRRCCANTWRRPVTDWHNHRPDWTNEGRRVLIFAFAAPRRRRWSRPKKNPGSKVSWSRWPS